MKTQTWLLISCFVIGSCADVTKSVAPDADNPTELVVNTLADVIDGNVTSPHHLTLSPGGGGISLREAITASNQTTGRHVIRFSADLLTRSIVLAGSLPAITRDSVTIIGLVGPDGVPGIALDGTAVKSAALIIVSASAFRLSYMRFISADSKAVEIVNTGLRLPLEITGVTIDRNLFTNPGVSAAGSAVSIEIQPIATGARIKDVVVKGNAFHHYANPALQVENAGSSGAIEDVSILENLFTECTVCVGLVTLGSNNRTAGVGIKRNRFEASYNPINVVNGSMNGISTNNVIDSTLVAENVLLQSGGSSVLLSGGYAASHDNRTLNSEITNNLIFGSGGASIGITVSVGSAGGFSNHVESVRIVNNTIVNHGGAAIVVGGTQPGGNSITGLQIVNTIMWMNHADIMGLPQDFQVSNSLFSKPAGAGSDGNIFADPRFVNYWEGDLHLLEGSPALGAGRTDGAPATDLECRRRVGVIDLGAFAGNGPALCELPRFFWR
jgi:hypothetical protein